VEEIGSSIQELLFCFSIIIMIIMIIMFIMIKSLFPPSRFRSPITRFIMEKISRQPVLKSHYAGYGSEERQS